MNHASNGLFLTKDSQKTANTAATSNFTESAEIPAFMKAMTATQDVKSSSIEDTLQDLFLSDDSFIAKNQ